jgi:phosphodiesterase/alkaline phosphatase D-like protein
MRMYGKLLCTMTLIAATAMLQPLAAQKHSPKKELKKDVQITDGPRVESTGDTTAVIAWTTSTGGSSIVHYGTDRNNLSERAESPYADKNQLKSGHEVHRVKVNGLRPGTEYFFVADSGQGEGTGSEAKSGVQSFTTKGSRGGSARGGGDSDDRGKHEAVKIVNGPRVEGTGNSWAMIAWTTNTGGGTVVKYGTDRNNLSQMAEAPYADKDSLKTGHEVHRVKVSGLKPSTRYYYMIDSAHGEGTGSEAKSGVQEFTTKK